MAPVLFHEHAAPDISAVERPRFLYRVVRSATGSATAAARHGGGPPLLAFSQLLGQPRNSRGVRPCVPEAWTVDRVGRAPGGRDPSAVRLARALGR